MRIAVTTHSATHAHRNACSVAATTYGPHCAHPTHPNFVWLAFQLHAGTNILFDGGNGGLRETVPIRLRVSQRIALPLHPSNDTQRRRGRRTTKPQKQAHERGAQQRRSRAPLLPTENATTRQSDGREKQRARADCQNKHCEWDCA